MQRHNLWCGWSNFSQNPIPITWKQCMQCSTSTTSMKATEDIIIDLQNIPASQQVKFFKWVQELQSGKRINFSSLMNMLKLSIVNNQHASRARNMERDGLNWQHDIPPEWHDRRGQNNLPGWGRARIAATSADQHTEQKGFFIWEVRPHGHRSSASQYNNISIFAACPKAAQRTRDWNPTPGWDTFAGIFYSREVCSRRPNWLYLVPIFLGTEEAGHWCLIAIFKQRRLRTAAVLDLLGSGNANSIKGKLISQTFKPYRGHVGWLD